MNTKGQSSGYDIEVTPSAELVGSVSGGSRGQGGGSDIDVTPSEDLVQDVQQDENEGEGSRTAGRRYNQATEAYARSGRVGPAASQAKDALDGDEGQELQQAEQIGKQGGNNEGGGTIQNW
jgi:hypothetical protein